MDLNHLLLLCLDYFFIFSHAALILLIIFGWIFKKTRKLHLVTVFLTAFSWFILGIFYGWGYCFCTDWHWRVREALGYPIASYSYIHFLIRELTGKEFPPEWVDRWVFVVFVFCFAMSIALNILNDRKRPGV